MKRIVLSLLFVVMLTACAPQVTATSEVTVTLTPPPQIENTEIVPTPTEREMTIEELASRILAGEQIDTSLLTPEQRAALDAELAKHAGEIAQGYVDAPEDFRLPDSLELANLVRVEIAELLQPKYAQEIVYTGDKDQKVCLDPETLTMKLCGEGAPELAKFQPISELQENPDGTYAYTDQWGETHQIVGLDKDDELHIVKDAQTDLIDFPQADIVPTGDRAGMPVTQAWLAGSHTDSVPEHRKNGCYINDIVYLRQVLGRAYFDFNIGRPEPLATLEFGKVIRDNDGTPLFLYKFLVTPSNNSLIVYQEGSDEKKAVVDNGARDWIFVGMPTNHMLWLGVYENEISSSFYYAPQNTQDWSDLALHTKAAMEFLQKGKLPKSEIPMLEAVFAIFEANQE